MACKSKEGWLLVVTVLGDKTPPSRDIFLPLQAMEIFSQTVSGRSHNMTQKYWHSQQKPIKDSCSTALKVRVTYPMWSQTLEVVS